LTFPNRRIRRIVLLAVTALVVLFADDEIDHPTLVTTADARIGRPLTPMSYAGVARRTTRRGAYAAGAAAAAGAYYGRGCYQTVDAYGRVYTRCR
jgi:hypothetical protein